MHDVPLQIDLPVIEADVFDRLIESLEELRDGDIERWLIRPYSRQVLTPVNRWSEVRKLLHRT